MNTCVSLGIFWSVIFQQPPTWGELTHLADLFSLTVLKCDYHLDTWMLQVLGTLFLVSLVVIIKVAKCEWKTNENPPPSALV